MELLSFLGTTIRGYCVFGGNLHSRFQSCNRKIAKKHSVFRTISSGSVLAAAKIHGNVTLP
jgi:hypothetical protein